MSKDKDQTFSLQSFEQSEKEDEFEQSLQSLIVEKDVPQVQKTQNEVDHYYQQLSLSFYSQNFMSDKKVILQSNEKVSQPDRQKAKTESSKMLYQQPQLSNGISESTAVESQHQFNFHVTQSQNIVQSNSNENIVRKEQMKTIHQQDDITFYTPEIEDKMLVLKQPTIMTDRTEKKPQYPQPQIINKVAGSNSFYQASKKKQRHPQQQQQAKVNQNLQLNFNFREAEKFIPSCYFTQKMQNQQPNKKKVIDYVVDKINLSVLKKLIEKNKNASSSSSNSFYFTKRGKASPESPCSSATSNISVKSGNTNSKLLSLLQSPSIQNSSKKQSPNSKNKPEKILQKQQNDQQEYLEKQLEQIRKFQTIQAIKNNICKADYGLETQNTPRMEPKTQSKQIQMNLDKQLKKLLRKPK